MQPRLVERRSPTTGHVESMSLIPSKLDTLAEKSKQARRSPTTGRIAIFVFGLVLLLLSTRSSDRIVSTRSLDQVNYLRDYYSVASLPMPQILRESLLRTSGDGWEVYHGPAIEQKMKTEKVNEDFGCKWVEFKATRGKTAKFCAHTIDDGVSGNIEEFGHFNHCDILPKMWDDVPDKGENSVYVEIGANIGSCVMEMLLSTDATVIAFEPNPRNQYVMKNTIAAMDKSYQDRFVLVPVALGKETAKNKIYTAKGNSGNSVVGKIIKDNPRQEFPENQQYDISVERISDIISTYPDVAFIKMDAQGFECQIMSGLDQELANKIRKVKFEVTNKHLKNQKCNDLLSMFRNLGFRITDESGRRTIEGESDQFKRMTELVALRD